MSDEKINRTEVLHVRLTTKERQAVQSKFTNSTCRHFSEYVRKILLGKPITIKQRNQSVDDFLSEMIALKNELNAIGNNYNQVVKRLHVLQDLPDIKNWLMHNENSKKILLEKIEQIKLKMNQINDQWLQESTKVKA
jgi:hypothetical protein